MDIATPDTGRADALPPLTPAVFHIMLALGGGCLHGYAIMQEVERLTGGATSLGPGTLYRSVQRMLVDGLIEELEDHDVPESEDERRRYYRLTQRGREVAGAEARRLLVLVNAARKARLLPQPAPAQAAGRRNRTRRPAERKAPRE